MTDEAKQAARERAKVKELEGYWLTLDFPSYDSVISYADNRALRREVYEAYVTRASDRGPQAGPFDNSALMEEILAPIGRAHVCTPVTNAQLVFRLLLLKQTAYQHTSEANQSK